MLGFLSHTNTIQIHLYSYYVLRITNTNTIRVHSSGIQIHQSINWSINQLVHTQYNHSLQIISIHSFTPHSKQKKQMMAQTWLSRLAIVCLFIFLSHLCFETEEQTNKYDRPNQWSTCFHDQKSLVGLVRKGGKYLFPPTGVLWFHRAIFCGFPLHAKLRLESLSLDLRHF